jgi:hypothetical protein
VHLRRALLLFALILGLTALATAVAPPPPKSDNSPVAPPAPPPVQHDERTLNFPAPPPDGHARTHEVQPDDRVIVQVSAGAGGEATIPTLGQTAPVTGSVPARFDLIDLPPGRYEVMFAPALEPAARVGTIVSKG